jgi:hypothetical protein
MLGSAILESAVGTILIYILLSLFCSVLNEWISRLLGFRSDILEHEVEQLLGANIAGAFRNHPLIRGTFEKGRYPQYLPPDVVALALVQLGYDYTPGTHGHPGTTSVRTRWQGRDELLLEGLRQASTSLGPVQTRFEEWFSEAMEQASGRFKRKVQTVILVISAIIVGIANVDTLTIAGNLYTGALSHSPVTFPFGWSMAAKPSFQQLCGLILTWGAVSLGAPFWFDLLNKVVNLRQTGLPPDEATREASSSRFVAQ